MPALYGRLGEGEAMTQPSAIDVCLMLSTLSLYYIQRVVYRVACTGTGQRRAIRRKLN